MYAIVEFGGKQYRVQQGDSLKVELVHAEPGDKVNIDKVLILADDQGVKIGEPYVKGASVEASVVKHGKDDKILVFKYKSKKNYRRFRGHRQNYSELKINSIKG
ncbi:MAG TPA: 50S ribosomal protein L21 [Synergistales bacterium]|nr:50S ribosomal protein L21 [Synergistales bacterium]